MNVILTQMTSNFVLEDKEKETNQVGYLPICFQDIIEHPIAKKYNRIPLAYIWFVDKNKIGKIDYEELRNKLDQFEYLTGVEDFSFVYNQDKELKAELYEVSINTFQKAYLFGFYEIPCKSQPKSKNVMIKKVSELKESDCILVEIGSHIMVYHQIERIKKIGEYVFDGYVDIDSRGKFLKLVQLNNLSVYVR